MRPLVLLPLLLLMSACTFATPFDPVSEAKSDSVVLSLTYAKVKPGAGLEFMRYSRDIAEMSETIPGFIGSSKRGNVLTNELWTMTVWEDEASLRAFLKTDLHRSAAAKVFDLTSDGKFLRLTAPRASIPMAWAEAEQRLQAEGREIWE